MSQARKALARMKAGPNNVAIADLKSVLRAHGFEHDRTSGSHEIWKHGSGAVVNIQAMGGGKAKPYQVKQVLGVLSALQDETTEDESDDVSEERE